MNAEPCRCQRCTDMRAIQWRIAKLQAQLAAVINRDCPTRTKRKARNQ